MEPARFSGKGKERMNAGDMAKECLIRGQDIRLAASACLEKRDREAKMWTSKGWFVQGTENEFDFKNKFLY